MNQVEAAFFKPNMVVIFVSVNVTTEVKSAKGHSEPLSQDLPEDNMGFSVKNMY